MELIACILVVVAIGIVLLGGWEDLGCFLVAFYVSVALISLAYVGLSILAS